MSSLYERIGGQNAVNAAVDVFYRKVLADNRVNQFFNDIDMDRQMAKQKNFLTLAFGGPNNYTDKNMREGHQNLNLQDEHFDVIVSHLGNTLQELGVKNEDIEEVKKNRFLCTQ